MQAGNEITQTIYEGVTHEFFGMGAVVDKAREVGMEVAQALMTAVGSWRHGHARRLTRETRKDTRQPELPGVLACLAAGQAFSPFWTR